MEGLNLGQIARLLECQLRGADPQTPVAAVCTDSRQVPSGSVFIAIKGEKFDGHAFIASALEKGAVCAVSQRREDQGKERILFVEDTGRALLAVAGLYRSQFDIPLVGVTGSVGKTTTKEMIACFLSANYRVHKTQGNLNNEIGLPHTLFGLDAADEAAVIEMGTSRSGEIHALAQAARPTIGVVTCIGVSHIEHFGSKEAIAEEKLHIADFMGERGTLVLNADDPLLLSAVGRQRCRVMTYGLQTPNATVTACDITDDGFTQRFTICFGEERYKAALPCAGKHNLLNALAAFCCGVLLGVTLEEGVRQLEDYQPSGMRQRLAHLGSWVLIEDCYNASPDSMEAALGVLAQIGQGRRKIAVLGDMCELGDYANEAHLHVGRLCAEKKIDALYCYGKLAALYADGARKAAPGMEIECFTDKQALVRLLQTQTDQPCAVLFKASRAMALEEVIDSLQRSSGK